MPEPRFHNRRSRRPLALAVGAGLLLLAWIGCHEGSRDAEAFTSAGVTHLQQQQYDRAIRDFDRALALQPGLVVAWKNRALAHRGLRDYERALADYDQATLFAPTDARLVTERGATYVLLDDYRKALREFDRAIALKPDNVPALESRGRVHFYLGNFAQAAADLQRALTMDSTDAYGALWLHLVRRRLRQDDRPDLEAHAAAMDTTQWPAPLVRYLLGRLPYDSLRVAAAAAEVKGQKQGCVAAFYLGEEALMMEETDEAMTLLGETRDSCPKELSEYKGAVAELRRIAR